jgi:predicted  nucleic acid-binding Zn-ribbon protein
MDCAALPVAGRPAVTLGGAPEAALLSIAAAASARPRSARIPVLESLQHLLELQQLDSEIASREEALVSLPGKRKQFEETRAAVAANLAQAHETLQSSELGQREAEATLQDQEALLKRLEGQQFQVKDNTAYTALLHEMDHAKQVISDCETRILEGMEAAEAAREALAAAEAEERETRERLDSEETATDAREEQLQRELAELGAQRGQVGPKLDVKILATYEKILTRRRPALALVSDEMCQGCRVGIPAQNYIEILKGERIITCGNCHRILLHPEMVSSARVS